MLGVFAAGRIINPLAARSQIIGGMTMGAGAALMEELVVDKRVGFFVNHDMAGYEVPVHADIPHQEVFFLDEVDPTAGPLKAKGVGELGISGVPAAIANAVYNATGIRSAIIRSRWTNCWSACRGRPDHRIDKEADMHHVTLNNGLEMPILGFGVFQIADPPNANAPWSMRSGRATA
jgi:hypothetical protein